MKDETKYYKHDLIPEHVPVTDENEIKQLLDKYGPFENFPKLKKNDAGLKTMMELHDFKVAKGMIIKINRKDFTGDSVYYRVVE